MQPATWAARLRMVRRFAVWLSATDRRTEVPPVGLLPHRYRRRRPYIYSDAEIDKLVQAAGRLPSPLGVNGRTYSTIFGLLSVTGMRVSEALALDREDVNLEEGILTIRRTKFGKSRLIPLHDSTRQALIDYAESEGTGCSLARHSGLLSLGTWQSCDPMDHAIELRQGFA